MANTIASFNVNGQNIRTFANVLQGGSALAAVTAAAGGQVLPNVDFRAHKFPIVTRTTKPSKYAEGATRSSVQATLSSAALNVEIWEDWNPITKELMRNQDPVGTAQQVVNASAALFPVAFDDDHLATIVGGASVTSVEYDAADPIGSMEALLTPYDETSYMPSGMILTRRGRRVLKFAQDNDAKMQAPQGVSDLVDLPRAVTNSTGTTLGVASLLAIVGPYHAGAWATNGGMRSSERRDATVDGLGPGTGHVQFENEAAMGYANALDPSGLGNGFTILVDAV